MSLRIMVVSLFLLTILTASGLFAGETDPGKPGIVYSADADGDGIPDDVDNCPAVYNPNQSDYNDDGVGNACDCCENMGDFNHDGRVDMEDIVNWLPWSWAILWSDPPGCAEGEEGNRYYPELDMDGTGRVDVADVVWWVNWSFNGGMSAEPCPGD